MSILLHHNSIHSNKQDEQQADYNLIVFSLPWLSTNRIAEKGEVFQITYPSQGCKEASPCFGSLALKLLKLSTSDQDIYSLLK